MPVDNVHGNSAEPSPMGFPAPAKISGSNLKLPLADLVELLFAAGCGDALIGAGRPGHIALKFTRRDHSKIAALESARADVMTAIPTALVID